MDSSVTGILLFVAALVLLGWDLFAYLTGKDRTISEIVSKAGWYSPMVPFIVGLVVGHLFWPLAG